MLSRFLLIFTVIKVVASAYSPYCTPYNTTCWPTASQWTEFKNSLDGNLHQILLSNYSECIKQGDNSVKISATGGGICMQYHDCSKKLCNISAEWNLPSYSVEVKTHDDIKKSFEFANKYNIAVTVKTSGHSYAGSSTGNDSLLIWMHNFQKYGNISSNFLDTCGKIHANVIKVGGGQSWGEVYETIGNKFHIVGGNGLSVSAAGGWLQGCGLSALSRSHGIGIDNVLQFEIMLSNGTLVTADACHNEDLFWALRGGGGGTFGVVTAVHYRLHTVQPVVFFKMQISNLTAIEAFIEKWIEWSPNLDNRWGGYWTLFELYLYFIGNRSEADSTFLNNFNDWKDSLSVPEKNSFTISISQSDSYYSARNGTYAETDSTGYPDFYIASRLIPREWVVNNRSQVSDLLRFILHDKFFTFNYFLGGVVQDVSENATSVHPAMRKAIWQINTFDRDTAKKVREVVKDTAPGFNHAAKDEPDWENAFWGPHLERLKSLKQHYDPFNRMNCWHCVGYVTDDDTPTTTQAPTSPVTTQAPTSPVTTTAKSSSTYIARSMCSLIGLMVIVGTMLN